MSTPVARVSLVTLPALEAELEELEPLPEEPELELDRAERTFEYGISRERGTRCLRKSHQPVI